MPSPDSHIECVRRDLKFAAPSAETLKYLRSILNLPPSHNRSTHSSAASTKADNCSKLSASNPSKPRPARGAASVRPLQKAPQIPATITSHDQRRKLATEVFNTSLKHLGDAVKAEKAKSHAGETGFPDTVHPKPLQECSPNKARKGQAVKKVDGGRKHNDSTVSQQDQRATLASCALSALEYLLVEDIVAIPQKSEQKKMIQSGSLILLDRTIALGLTSEAESQARAIYRSYWSDYPKKPTDGCERTETLHNYILGRADAIEDRSLFGFTASMQSQIMRLAISLGPRSIDDAFVHSLELETIGSPGWITIQGMQNGHQNRETTGSQLRAISLAASKLYSLAVKSTFSLVDTDVAYSLFCVALDIKFESWRYLTTVPEVQADVWRHFISATKRATSTIAPFPSGQRVLAALRRIQRSLESLGQDASVPLEFIECLARADPQVRNQTEIQSLLNDSVTPKDPMTLITIKCQTIASLLDVPSNDTRTAMSSLAQSMHSFAPNPPLTIGQLEQILVAAATLRKALLEKALIPFQADQHDLEKPYLQQDCIHLLLTSSELILKQIKSTVQASPMNPNSEKVGRILCSLIKNADALLAIDKAAPDSFAEWGDAIQSCSAIVSLLRTCCARGEFNDSIVKAVHQIQGRVSQAFWQRYLKAVGSRKSISEQILHLQSSIEVLSDLGAPEQTAMGLSLKYQKLASCHAELDDFPRAMSLLRQAIELDVVNGSVEFAVQRTLSYPSREIWSDIESGIVSLSTNLAKYTDVYLQSPSPPENSDMFYDPHHLPAIHRAVVIEKQILHVVEKQLSHQQRVCIKSQVDFLLSLLCEPRYEVLRLRVVSRLLDVQTRTGLNERFLPFDAELIRSLLSPVEGVLEDTYLYSLRPALRLLIGLQYDILNGEVTTQNLGKYLQDLGDLVFHCKTPKSLSSAIDDPEVLVSVLFRCLNCASVLEDPISARQALKILCVLVDLGHLAKNMSKTDILLQLARVHMQLQELELANDALRDAKTSTSVQETDPLIEVDWAIAQSELYFLMDDCARSSASLDHAQAVWRDAQSFSDPGRKRRLRSQLLLCRAADLASRLAFQYGELSNATQYARQSVKIIAGIWSSIEKSWQDADLRPASSPNGNSVTQLALTMSSLDLAGSQEPMRDEQFAARYLQLILLYCSTFRNLASLTAHCGQYQNAVFFLEQALNVAKKAKLPMSMTSIQGELTLLHAQASEYSKAREIMKASLPISSHNGLGLERAMCSINQAEAQLWLGDDAAIHSLLQDASQQLLLYLNVPDGHAHISSKVEKVKAPTQPSRQKSVSKKSNPSPTSSSVVAERPKIVSTRAIRNMQMRIAAIQSDTRLPVRGDSSTGAGSQGFEIDPVNFRASIAEAQRLLHGAFKRFSEDTASNALAETAVALPVRYKSSRKSGRFSFVLHTANTPDIGKTATRKLKTSKAIVSSKQEDADGKTLLANAYEHISKVMKESSHLIPLDLVHTIHKLLSQITLLSTALGNAPIDSSQQLFSYAIASLDEMQTRATALKSAEIATADVSKVQHWPATRYHAAIVDCDEGVEHDLKSTLRWLPRSWAVVSLGLNQDHNELLVTRTTQSQSPFVLRIPLTRPDPAALDHDELSFDSAKMELHQIVKEANISAHDTRGCAADKNVRKAWFAERLALDARLSALLDDIENLWFGGFRGLLSAGQRHDVELSRFSKAFTSILNRHLPSRQKLSKSRATTKIELHTHVLELFVTLGHPQKRDVEDAITDLIYFVIDILQFNGEHNAYDEIDFDSVLVEVMEALHAYHGETSNQEDNKSNSHTILILDKELQAFPWESMPCLRGLSVSRMPSLKATRMRLEQIQNQGKHTEGFVASSTRGTYMLNPSSDLASTQDTFQPLFERQLAYFTAIVKRAPTEAEFEKALKTDDLLLYFGHGGGAQYIRGGTIRKLQQCAVTLLMGCSSAKLTEYGVFESQGMPWNYISGGSLAVVGTLWDVTDRDIDRFAMEVMSEWGLIQKPDETYPKSGNKAAKQAVVKNGNKVMDQKRGEVSLDQAVARARESCLLKYLNGAAPVVYGVPVFLE